MAIAKKCDLCGVFYEGRDDRVFTSPEGFKINSIRIGEWDNKNKEWVGIASAYDICEKCGSKLYEMICGAEVSSVKMRANKNRKAKVEVPESNTAEPTPNGATDVKAAAIDSDQAELAKSEENA